MNDNERNVLAALLAGVNYGFAHPNTYLVRRLTLIKRDLEDIVINLWGPSVEESGMLETMIEEANSWLSRPEALNSYKKLVEFY